MRLTWDVHVVGSRLPQLALNRKTKCEGLSLLMFCFAVIGNITFVAVCFPLPLPLSLSHYWVPPSVHRVELEADEIVRLSEIEYLVDFNVVTTYLGQCSLVVGVWRNNLPRLPRTRTSECCPFPLLALSPSLQSVWNQELTTSFRNPLF